MIDIPRRKLCEIVSEHGSNVIDNPRRCKALLLDYYGGYKRERNVLLNAVKERIPHDLLHAPNNIPPVVLIARLVRRLADNQAMVEDDARWAVESWALALKVALPKKLDEPISERPDTAMPTPEPQSSPVSTAPSLVGTSSPSPVSTLPHTSLNLGSAQSSWDLNRVAQELQQVGWQVSPEEYAGIKFDLFGKKLLSLPAMPAMLKPLVKRLLVDAEETVPHIFIKRIPVLDPQTATIWQKRLEDIRNVLSKRLVRDSLHQTLPVIFCLVTQRLPSSILSGIENDTFGRFIPHALSLKLETLSCLFIVDESKQAVHLKMPDGWWRPSKPIHQVEEILKKGF